MWYINSQYHVAVHMFFLWSQVCCFFFLVGGGGGGGGGVVQVVVSHANGKIETSIPFVLLFLICSLLSE
jgi:hypothetical protein